MSSPRPAKEGDNTCSALLRFALHELLYHSLISIRSACSDPRLVFVHADHIHNIPDLLWNFTPDRLRHYWEVERPCFLQKLPHGNTPPQIFEPIWATIEREYQRICKPVNR